MSDLRCSRCGALLARDHSGMTELKRSGIEVRAYGIESMSVTCPRCDVQTQTIFTRISGELRRSVQTC